MMRESWDRRRAGTWTLRALALGSLLAVIAALPAGSAPIMVVSVATELVACAIFLVRVTKMPGRPPLVWELLWSSVALLAAGDLVYAVGSRLGEQSFPGPSDVFYLASYVPQMAAVVLLVRPRHPGIDVGELLDAAILSVPVLVFTGVFVVEPMLAGQQADPASLIAVAYPALDAVVLTGLIRISVGGGHKNRSLLLIILSVGVALVADLVFAAVGLAMGETEVDPSWLTALFTGSILLMTAASLSTDAPFVNQPERAKHVTMGPGRATALAVAALSLPLLQLFDAGPSTVPADKVFEAATIVVMLLVLARCFTIMRLVLAQQHNLDQLARTDELTGLPNRRSWDHELARTEQLMAGRDEPVTLAMLDLDLFKTFNDTFGHAAGDRLLQEAATCWVAAMPRDCYLARYGGEEFAMVLPNRTLAAAERVLDTVRTSTPSGITVSIGCAQHERGETLLETLAHADAALYAAKKRGRDMVLGIVYQPSPPPLAAVRPEARAEGRSA